MPEAHSEALAPLPFLASTAEFTSPLGSREGLFGLTGTVVPTPRHHVALGYHFNAIH